MAIIVLEEYIKPQDCSVASCADMYAGLLINFVYCASCACSSVIAIPSLTTEQTKATAQPIMDKSH